MWMAAIALLSVIGAWHAWRRNPAYSNRSTLRLVGVTALCITALGMIFIIQYASTPKSARLTTTLPPSAKLVHVHRQKVYKLAKFFAILLAGNQLIPIYQSVLIPEGAEADLARLQHELSTRFPALPIALI